MIHIGTHRSCIFGLVCVGLFGGCASSPSTPRSGPVMSSTGQLPAYAAEMRDQTPPLRWNRLEDAIVNQARDEGKVLPKERIREAASRYAAYINSCEPDELEHQYQLDRATLVLQRSDASVVMLAEGANLRGSSQSAGRNSSRSSGNSSRDIGRTNRSSRNNSGSSSLSGTTTTGSGSSSRTN